MATATTLYYALTVDFLRQAILAEETLAEETLAVDPTVEVFFNFKNFIKNLLVGGKQWSDFPDKYPKNYKISAS